MNTLPDDRDEEDRPREACGVFGIYAPGEDVARAAYFGLYALQHRGQESAGIVVGDGEVLHVQRGMGLVSQVFDEAAMKPLQGFLAVGHCRYATTGESTARNAQPLVAKDGPAGPRPGAPFALAHNGNLVNAEEIDRHRARPLSTRTVAAPPGRRPAATEGTAVAE